MATSHTGSEIGDLVRIHAGALAWKTLCTFVKLLTSQVVVVVVPFLSLRGIYLYLWWVCLQSAKLSRSRPYVLGKDEKKGPGERRQEQNLKYAVSPQLLDSFAQHIGGRQELMTRLRNPGYKFGEICVYKLIVSHLPRPM